MVNSPIWVAIVELPDSFGRLRVESELEGFGFLGRLDRDWRSGDNRFDLPGEQLLGAFVENRLVAIGGLNRDPYVTDGETARLRHMYVSKDYRLTGVGRALVDQLLERAKGVFSKVHLRTDTNQASAFYLRCGFASVLNETATHVRVI